MSSTSSSSSRISTVYMQRTLEKLLMNQHRSSTAKNYFRIWRTFNDFIVRLDIRPKLWEERTSLFVAYMIDKGAQSSTIKSYVSAIKKTLVMDKYPWKDELIKLSSLTRACKLVNDKIQVRLPIHCGLLEQILFEIQRYFRKKNQPYLEIMYKALFALGYYGLMRVGELTQSEHVVKAQDVCLATNKDKILLILYSSKTHSRADRPQRIRITANSSEKSGKYSNRHFCPFELINRYFKVRPPFESDEEPFFVFRNGTPVTPEVARNVLKSMLTNLGLNSDLYNMHSLRIGRASDLIKYNYPIEIIKIMGRWKSNVVYKYFRN